MVFHFDCAFCDVVVETDAVEAVKADASDHLEDHHCAELEEVFAIAFGDRRCRNDCGYVFPERPAEIEGFDCPACGHDNFPAFVEQYVYWRIEKT